MYQRPFASLKSRIRAKGAMAMNDKELLSSHILKTESLRINAASFHFSSFLISGASRDLGIPQFKRCLL